MAVTGFDYRLGVNISRILPLSPRALDAKAQQSEQTSISVVELARLRRSRKSKLVVVEQHGGRRGVKVDFWSRRGDQPLLG